MSNLNTILNKLGKIDEFDKVKETKLAKWQEQILSITENDNNIDLSKHDINLSLVDDLKAYISNSKTIEKSFNDLNKRVINLQKEKESILNKKSELYSNISKSNSNANKTLFDFIKQAKELGINPTDNPLYKQANELYDVNSVYLDKLESFNKI